MHNRSESPLARRVGTHREPRRGDWRRRVRPGRRDGLAGLGSDVRNRRLLAAASVSVAAVLVVAGTHVVLSAAGPDAPADLEAAGQDAGPQWNVPQPGELVPTAAPSSAPVRPRAEGSAVTPSASTSPLHQLIRPDPPAPPAHAVPPPRAVHPTPTVAPKPPPATSPPPRTKVPTGKPTPTKADPTTTAPALPITTGTGTLTGVAGRCLGVADDRGADGAAVQLFGCDGSNTQLWTVQGGTLQALGRCLSASGDSAGSRLELHDCDGAEAQHWQLSAGALVDPSSTLCLGVQDQATDDGTPVVTAACAADPGQSWTLS